MLAARHDRNVRVLVVTGPPAVGKSTVGRLVATRGQRRALVDIDDVRHLVISGHTAPWEGEEGARQQRLGVVNGCALAGNFVSHGIDVVIVDVLSEETASLYRELLPDPLIVRLSVDYPEALRRAQTRKVHLSWDEFRALHAQQTSLKAADVQVDTTHLSAQDTADRLMGLWTGS